MKINFVILLFFLSITDVIAQQQTIENNFGSWYMYHGDHKISKRWSAVTGVQERNYETFQNYNLFLIYLGASFKVNKKWTANITYGYLDIDRSFDPDIVPNTIEHRFFEQFTYKTTFLKVHIFQRFRFEHRNLYTLDSYSLINRFRYRLKIKPSISENVYTTVSNEVFFNFKDLVYAENRFYTALGYKLNKKITIELGYLNQYINNLNLNRLQLSLFLKTGYKN